MSNAVRWQYTLPWLLVLLALLFVAQLVLARLVQSSLRDSGKATLGTNVHVRDVRVSLVTSRLSLRQVHIANPFHPSHNLVEADRCELHIEPSGLLRKRLVVDRGVVTGVRWKMSCGDRSGAGALHDSTSPDWLDPHAANAARAWLDRLQHRFDGKLLEQLQSVRLTEELLARWPERYADMRDRVNHMQARIEAFQENVRKAQLNPLRHVEFCEAMPDEIDRLRDDLATLTDDIRKAPGTIDADRRAIVAARKLDEQFLREQLQFERIDANSLTAFLLEQQLAGPLADAVAWLRWLRSIAPPDPQPAIENRRGQDVIFAGCERAPDFLIRTLDIRGIGRFGDQSLELAGTLTDLASQPRLHPQPLRLRLTAAGPMKLDLQATIDRTGEVPRDQLLIDCDRALMPHLRLGGSDQLRLALAPAEALVNISLRLEGDRLSGDIQFVQKQVRITPEVSAPLARAGLDRELAESLHRIGPLATRISLRGSLDEPSCQIWSNLGPAVTEALDRALNRSAQRYCQQLLADAQKRVDERLAQLDRQLSDGQATLIPQLAASNRVIAAMSDGEPAPQRLSIEHLGRRLPADSLFR